MIRELFEQWYDSEDIGKKTTLRRQTDAHAKWHPEEQRYTVMSLKQQQWLAFQAGYKKAEECSST